MPKQKQNTTPAGTPYVSESAPSHGAAVETKLKEVITGQIGGAIADVAKIEAVRDRAVSGIADRIHTLLDPNEFVADIFNEVANRPVTAYRPMFSGAVDGAVDVTAIIEPVKIKQEARASIAGFLAQGGSAVQSETAPSTPLALEGAGDAG